MIATALKIQSVPREAVFNDMTQYIANELLESRNFLDEDNFKQALFAYSATLASLTAALVTEAILTEQEMSDMIEAINEIEAIEKDVK